MQAEATVQAPVTGLEFNENKIITATPKELAVQCVVFVGNFLTPKQMKSPNYRLGGKLYPWPDFYTVPKGIVAKCAITRLQKAMRGVHKNHIDEKQWPQWTDSFTLQNQWDPARNEYRDIIVGVDGPSKELLYKEIKPVQELRGILRDGVVALDEECGISSGGDIKEAQFHYFPNWLEIATGEKYLPERLRDLEDHLRDRREKTLSPNIRAIGDAYLQSCQEYRDAAKETRIDRQSATIRETEKYGGARYDEVAERMFRELELTREDKLHENTARSQNDQAESNALIGQALNKLTDLVAPLVVNQQKAETSLPLAEQQPPAPATTEQAKDEIDRAVESSVADETLFTDMSAEIIEPETTPEDEEAAKYLADAGVETETVIEPESEEN